MTDAFKVTLPKDELDELVESMANDRIEDMARSMFEDTLYPADDDGAMDSAELRKVAREVATACFVAAEEFYAVASERAAERLRKAS